MYYAMLLLSSSLLVSRELHATSIVCRLPGGPTPRRPGVPPGRSAGQSVSRCSHDFSMRAFVRWILQLQVMLLSDHTIVIMCFCLHVFICSDHTLLCYVMLDGDALLFGQPPIRPSRNHFTQLQVQENP